MSVIECDTGYRITALMEYQAAITGKKNIQERFVQLYGKDRRFLGALEDEQHLIAIKIIFANLQTEQTTSFTTPSSSVFFFKTIINCTIIPNDSEFRSLSIAFRGLSRAIPNQMVDNKPTNPYTDPMVCSVISSYLPPKDFPAFAAVTHVINPHIALASDCLESKENPWKPLIQKYVVSDPTTLETASEMEKAVMLQKLLNMARSIGDMLGLSEAEPFKMFEHIESICQMEKIPSPNYFTLSGTLCFIQSINTIRIFPRLLASFHLRVIPYSEPSTATEDAQKIEIWIKNNISILLKANNHLSMSLEGITVLPSFLSLLTHLQELKLFNGPLIILPDWIGNLKNLKILTYQGTNIEEIPSSIQGLTRLTHLNLFNNKIRFLPEWIGDLNNLQELQLANNQLKSFPDSLARLPQLRVVTYTPNPINLVPQGFKNAKPCVRDIYLLWEVSKNK